jgi:CheY-like chemotaxis protein
VKAWTAAPDLILKPRRETPRLPGKRVLLVIRNASERRMIAEELTKAGYIVVAKDNCHDALRFCRESAVLHALVTDTTLPHMWGVELARSASQCHPHLVIVCVCSGEPKPLVKQELAKQGWQWTEKGGSFYETVIQQLQTGLTTFVAS